MFERQIDHPLYPKILWNRPVSRSGAGRLLIAGGHKTGLAKLQAAFQVAGATGIGSVSVLAPDVLRPMFGTIPEISFTAATLSGSLAKGALAELIDLSSHADATMVGLDASNNSETAILYESFIAKYHRPLVVCDDGLELIALTPDLFRSRPQTLAILSMQQLFKLAGKLQLALRLKPDSGINGKVEIVGDLWQTLKIDLAVIGPEIIIKAGQMVSVTPLSEQPSSLPPAAYAAMAVFYTQNPNAPFEGLTTAAYLLKSAISQATNPTIAEICTNLSQALDVMD